MEILAYVLYSQCSVALLSIVDHASQLSQIMHRSYRRSFIVDIVCFGSCMRRNYCCSFSVRGIAYLSLSHGLLWIVMALSFSGHLQRTAISWTSAFSVHLSVCLGHVSASVQHIFTSLHSTRSTPTSALPPLAVPTISTTNINSVERHSLAHVSRVSQTISTTGTFFNVPGRKSLPKC